MPIFAFVLIRSAMDNAHAEKQRKLELLEEALRSGAVDAETKEHLVQGIHGDLPRRPRRSQMARDPHAVGMMMKLVAFVGWMALCVGIGLAVASGLTRVDEEVEIAAAILCCVGFGLTTYPFVIRELQARAPSGNEA